MRAGAIWPVHVSPRIPVCSRGTRVRSRSTPVPRWRGWPRRGPAKCRFYPSSPAAASSPPTRERERVCGEARRSSFEREGGQGGGAHHPLGEVASVLASFSLVRRGVPLFILGGGKSRVLGGGVFADWIVVYAGAVGLVLFGAVLGGGGVFRGGEEGGFRGVLPWKFLFFCVLLRFSSVLGLKIAAF